MAENDRYLVLAFYIFTEIEDPHFLVKGHIRFFKGRDVTSRIYISEEGINGQMSAAKEDAKAYMDWLRSDPRFTSVEFKIHTSDKQVFPRCNVRYRKQLVAMDREVDMSVQGDYLSPKEWREMLENKDDDTLVLDVRNQYEWEVGHFEGAIPPQKNTFREFPKLAEELSKKYDPKQTKVMMYCTGGIRCEVYSSLLLEQGFSEVYQLQGGIIKYGTEEGNSKWKGKLFVFDDRLVVSLSDDEAELISHCIFCNDLSDLYYNCANMDCNDLFIACQNCIPTRQGCCSEKCSHGRVREFDESKTPTPFRRLSHEEKQSIDSSFSQ